MNATGITQLTSWTAQSLLPLFSALIPRLLQVEAALTGQAQCSVYVDHVEGPQAVALRIGICWYIAGNPTSEFLQSVNKLLPRDTYSVLILDPSITASLRAVLFGDLYFVRATSRYAERTTPDPIIHALAAGYCCRPIDRSFLESDAEGASDLRDGILHFWQSLSAYEQSGFGFVVMDGTEVVSHSLTDHVIGQR